MAARSTANPPSISSRRETDPPRIAPGTSAETGRLNFWIARLAGLAAGSGPPNLFTTLGRHRRLFRRWLRFAGGLMPGGLLPRADTELTILRVAHNTGCNYEWEHHQRLARVAGLTGEEVQRARLGADAPGWSERQRLLLRAADELHATASISDPLWSELSAQFSERELIELCLLIGHYEMLAMTLNALQVQPDGPGSGPPRVLRLLERAVRSRRPTGRPR